MKQTLVATGLATAALLTAGPALGQDAKAEQGMKVFAAQKCTMCHSIAGKGNKKGPLDEVGSKLAAAEIREWIVDPEGIRAKTKPTRKPPTKKKPMPAGDVDAPVALLTGLKKS